MVIGLAWFLCYSRHHLVAQAPEEEVALLSAARLELSHGDGENHIAPLEETGSQPLDAPDVTDNTP